MATEDPGNHGDRPARVRSSTFGHDAELGNELPPAWTLERFQTEVKSASREYFMSRDLDGAVQRMSDLLTECPTYADELGVVSIRIAVECNNEATHQATVDLLAALHGKKSLDTAALVRTFEKLFCTWEDICIDVPKAPELILSMLLQSITAGAVKKALLSKVPENLMTAGLPKLSQTKYPGRELLVEVAAELKEFKSQATCALDEYFSSLNVDNLEHRLREAGQRQYRHEFVKRAITKSYSQHDPAAARDAILTAFQHLTAAGELTKDDLQWGITRLLGQLSDLELDCPRASELSIEVLACMVADELVSVPFLRRCRILRIGGHDSLQVLDAAQRRTPEYSKKEMGTLQFKREIHTMILEYFNSSDKSEFGRCVGDLAPLGSERGAELVRKIMHLAMERSGAECEKALKLLVWLSRNEEVSEDILELGFSELYSRMGDVLLDVPDATEMAQSFVVEAKKAGILRSEWSASSVGRA